MIKRQWLIFVFSCKCGKEHNVKATKHFHLNYSEYTIFLTYCVLNLFTDLSLVSQILPDLSSGKIPYFNKTVNRSSYKVLTIRGEASTFNMSLLSKLQNKKKYKGLSQLFAKFGTCNYFSPMRRVILISCFAPQFPCAHIRHQHP